MSRRPTITISLNFFQQTLLEALVVTGASASCFGEQYIQHAHFIPIVGVGKRGAYQLVHGDLPRQHSFGTPLRFTGPVPAGSRQLTPSVRNCVTR